MKIEYGTVIEIKNGFAILEVSLQDMCASCVAHSACTVLGGGKKRISVRNSLRAREGDLVEFSISDRGSLISALIVYALPVVLLITGMVCGSILLHTRTCSSDSAMAVGGTAGILIAFGIIKLLNPIIKNMNIFHPRMLRITHTNDT